MNAVLEKLNKIGIVPVVVINNVEDAAPLAKALCAGGLPCAEVTFRTAAAKEAIKIMTETCPEMVVGAGTVLNAEQVDAAVEAGAAADGEEAREITVLHKEWLSMSIKQYHAQMHRGIAMMYVADERFTKYYDRNKTGCAQFLCDAVQAWINE